MDNLGAMGPPMVHVGVLSVQPGADISLEEIRRSLMEKGVRSSQPGTWTAPRSTTSCPV
ncbi:unnamed protein product [Arctogadus glacialis]